MVLHRGRERAINIYAFCTCEHTFMHISFEMLYSLSSSYHWWEGVRGVWERGRARLKQLIFFSRNWLSSLLAKTLVPRMLAIHICSYDLSLYGDLRFSSSCRLLERGWGVFERKSDSEVVAIDCLLEKLVVFNARTQAS